MGHDNIDLTEKYHADLAAAYVRGCLEDLPPEKLIRAGQAAGLKLQRFKQVGVLPRVAKVIEMLKSLCPTYLLDVGSGHGSSIIQLLREFPTLDIRAMDIDPERVTYLRALARGLKKITPAYYFDVFMGDVTQSVDMDQVKNVSFDGATLLEVLEHLEHPGVAVKNLMQAVCRFVIFSVPSEPDTNPRHLRRLTTTDLSEMFLAAGAVKVTFEKVPGHIVGLAMKEPCDVNPSITY